MAKIDKLINAAKPHMEEGESVLSVVMGVYGTKIMGNKSVRSGIFIATNKRIVLYGSKIFGYDMEVFPYSNISSIEMSKGILGYTIIFFASGNKIEMECINVGNVPEFIQLTKSKIGKDAELLAAPPKQSFDMVDQIRRLMELKNEGTLSEEEFQSKKVQLLSQI